MLSILIPAFNHSPTELVRKLYAQAQKLSVPLEIIVCDDGSQPPLPILKYAKLLRNKENVGRMATRKRLIEEAKFENILFLDADVLPIYDDFLSQYKREINQESQIVSGGFRYPETKPTGSELRWKYGHSREVIPLEKREKRPYSSFLSANYLIKKSIALELHNQVKMNTYGSDLWIGQYFKNHKLHVKLIDNPVLHLGLENNVVFLEKSLQAVTTLSRLIKTSPPELNSKLGNYYLKAKKWRVLFLVRLTFLLFAKPMKKNILGKNPVLRIFDLYRFGYLCKILKN